jgi:hypothetical protein
VGIFDAVRNLFGRGQAASAESDKIDIEQAVAYLKLLEFEGGDSIELADDALPVMHPLTGDLLVSYVVDIGPAFQFIQERDLKAAGLSRDELHRIGITNLSQKLSSNDLDIRQFSDVFMVILDQHFEASLMLTDSLWDEVMVEHLPGDVVAAVPSRDILLFCDAGSNDAVGFLKSQAEQIELGTHPLSKSLFLRDRATRTWRVFDPH